LCRGRLIVGCPVHAQVVVDNVGHGLRVGGRSRSTAPDRVVDLCELIGNAIGDVGTRRCPAVSGEYDAVLEVDGHAVGGQCACSTAPPGKTRTWTFLG